MGTQQINKRFIQHNNEVIYDTQEQLDLHIEEATDLINYLYNEYIKLIKINKELNQKNEYLKQAIALEEYRLKYK